MSESKRNATNTPETCGCGNPKAATALGCRACVTALLHDITTRLRSNGLISTALGGITLEEFISSTTEKGIGQVGTCSICGERYVFGGYNAGDGGRSRCCARCDRGHVIPARIAEFVRQYANEKSAE